MIKRGFMNVKVVSGEGVEGEISGKAMEKYFEYYDNGRIINPITGKVIVIKK
jgi:hypothetical protein